MNVPPEGWVETTLGEACRVEYGKGLSANQRIESGSVPVVGSAGVIGRHSASLVPGPVIVIGRKGNAGAIHLFRDACWPIDTTYFVRVPAAFEPAFLAYQLRDAQLRSLDSSTAVPSLRRPDLEACPLLVAPIGEQQRIVAVIEEQVSRLDAGVAALVAARDRLRKLRDTLFRMKQSRDWLTVPLSAAVAIVSGQTPKGLSASDDGEVPYYKVGDMNLAEGRLMVRARAYLDRDVVDRARMRVHPAGTVIFPKRGGAIATNKKRVLSVPAAFDLNTMGLVPGDRVESMFLLNWLESVDLGQLADGSNVPQINYGDVAPLPFPMPPLDEQRRVTEAVEAERSIVDSLEVAIDHALIRSNHLRHAVLSEAFSGRLVPQDPNDEPAFELLARVTVNGANAPKRRRRQRA